jgi:spore coat polysaccharide biosynthesis protein SpsF
VILGILQARLSSTRLPGKVLAPILDRPMLLHQIERVRRAQSLNDLVVATSEHPEDDLIFGLCCEHGIRCARGSLDDVLDRFVTAARPFSPGYVVRLTGDCPLTDQDVIDAVVDFAISGDFDYATNAIQPTYPDGLDVEVIRMSALEEAWREASLRSEREHVTPFLHKQPDRFRIGHFRSQPDLSGLRWTVDETADLEFVRAIYERLWLAKPMFGMNDILALLEQEPELARINNSFKRNEGYAISLEND